MTHPTVPELVAHYAEQAPLDIGRLARAAGAGGELLAAVDVALVRFGEMVEDVPVDARAILLALENAAVAAALVLRDAGPAADYDLGTGDA